MRAIDAPAYGAVVVATKDRSQNLRSCLSCLFEDRPKATVIVVDASDGEETRELCQELGHISLNLLYHRASSPSLARQRNEGADICDELPVEVIHFLDDDTEVQPGYLDAIERRFMSDIHIDGVGGIDVERKAPRKSVFTWLFLLNGRGQSRVLKSGRNVAGQGPDVKSPTNVEWLSGCTMSYRKRVFQSHRFDERLEGWSWGEDFDFGFRVSRSGRLVVEPEARCNHRTSPVNRLSRERLGYESTILLYCWVKEQRHNGMSLMLFWWSVAGEVLIRILRGVMASRRKELSQVRGMLRAIWLIWTKSSPRDFISTN